MKRIAFFIAVFVGLNATSVVRRPEEEGQAIVQHDKYPSRSVRYASIIRLLAETLNQYLFAITKNGIFHIISWERISVIPEMKTQQKSKVIKIVYQNNNLKPKEDPDIRIF